MVAAQGNMLVPAREDTAVEEENSAAAPGQDATTAQQEGKMLAQDEDNALVKEGDKKPAEEEGGVTSEEDGEVVSQEEGKVIFPEAGEVTVQGEDSGLFYQRATEPQITKHFENNSQMFAAPLSMADYMGVQRRLSETEASIGQTAYWVLCHHDDPETVICSCTTYMRDAVINQGHGMQPVGAVVITDLFTLPEHRRKGMATMLLKAVQGTLDHGVTRRAELSIVYSDRNPDFYDRLGWKQQPATHLRIVLGKNTIELPAETDELKYAHLPRLAQFAKQDVNMTKCRLSAKREKGKVYAQILPAQKLMRWHAARSLMMKGHLLKRDDKEGSWLGAMFTNAQTGAEVVAWWTADFRSRRLYVGRLASTRLKGVESEIKTVLKVAAAEATSLGFREVVLWEPTDQVVQGASLLVEELGQGARAVVEERPDMVPCLRWNGGEEKEGGLVDAQFYGWS